MIVGIGKLIDPYGPAVWQRILGPIAIVAFEFEFTILKYLPPTELT